MKKRTERNSPTTHKLVKSLDILEAVDVVDTSSRNQGNNARSLLAFQE